MNDATILEKEIEKETEKTETKSEAMPEITPIGFEEDSFDLAAHKKAADAVTREKSRVKRVHRQVIVGKVMLALATVVIFYLIAHIAFTSGLGSMF